jgi:hypothetical protein
VARITRANVASMRRVSIILPQVTVSSPSS